MTGNTTLIEPLRRMRDFIEQDGVDKLIAALYTAETVFDAKSDENEHDGPTVARDAEAILWMLRLAAEDMQTQLLDHMTIIENAVNRG